MCAGGSTPAGETQLSQLEVDSVGLIAPRGLAMGEEEVGVCIARQGNASYFGDEPCVLLLRLHCLGRRVACRLGSDRLAVLVLHLFWSV